MIGRGFFLGGGCKWRERRSGIYCGFVAQTREDAMPQRQKGNAGAAGSFTCPGGEGITSTSEPSDSTERKKKKKKDRSEKLKKNKGMYERNESKRKGKDRHIP